MCCKVCSLLAKMLGAQIYIYAAFWDPEMEVAIKWKSLLLFSASLHRLTTAGTNRCGPQRILQAVLGPSLLKFPFPRLTMGISPQSVQPPCVPCCYRWVQSSKNQTGLNLSSPLLFQWLFPNNMTLKEKYLFHGENFLHQGPYAMSGGCHNYIYGATALFMH